MKSSFGIVWLAVGIALLAFGLAASESLGSEAKKFFTGTPTDKSMWLLLAGIASTTWGAILSFRRA